MIVLFFNLGGLMLIVLWVAVSMNLMPKSAWFQNLWLNFLTVKTNRFYQTDNYRRSQLVFISWQVSFYYKTIMSYRYSIMHSSASPFYFILLLFCKSIHFVLITCFISMSLILGSIKLVEILPIFRWVRISFQTDQLVVVSPKMFS